TNGRSGEPLCSEGNVLIGLVYGTLASDNRFGLAVPSDAVAAFLKSSGANNQVRFVTAEELPACKGPYDPHSITVFIEILSEANSEAARSMQSPRSMEET